MLTLALAGRVLHLGRGDRRTVRELNSGIAGSDIPLFEGRRLILASSARLSDPTERQVSAVQSNQSNQPI
jgi:hypothetical protein